MQELVAHYENYYLATFLIQGCSKLGFRDKWNSSKTDTGAGMENGNGNL